MLLDDTPLVIVLLVASHALVCWVTWLCCQHKFDSLKEHHLDRFREWKESDQRMTRELARLRLVNAKLGREVLGGSPAPTDWAGRPTAEAQAATSQD